MWALGSGAQTDDFLGCAACARVVMAGIFSGASKLSRRFGGNAGFTGSHECDDGRVFPARPGGRTVDASPMRLGRLCGGTNLPNSTSKPLEPHGGPQMNDAGG